MTMFLSVVLALCLSGFAASSQYDEIQFAVWSEPDVVGNSNCGCSKEPLPQCGCQVDIEVKGKHYIFEMNMTYIKEDNGLQYTVTLNGKLLYKQTFVAKPPAPICLGTCPSSCICIDYSNVSYGEDDKWGACIELIVEGGGSRLDLKLGCFYLPMNQEEKKITDKVIHQSRLFNEMQQRLQDTFGKKMSDRGLKKRNPFDVLFRSRVVKDNKESDTLVFNN